MWKIKKLPQHIINILKAWEIIDRPSSIVKELIENSIDANADEIVVKIFDWWKKLICIEDNWTWISKDDINICIERYTTSKINLENDIYDIRSYWFRGEALSSIAQVCIFKIQSKTKEAIIWTQLSKQDENIFLDNIPFEKLSWTNVFVENLFYNVPARLKFLKSATSEFAHINETFLDLCIVNPNVKFVMFRDWKKIYQFEKTDQKNRIFQVYDHINPNNTILIERDEKDLNIFWLISDSKLWFDSSNFIKIFVNNRPIKDNIIKKAIIDWYYRQISSDRYPFVCIFINIDPKLVDQNTHPRKLNVKFLEPWSIYNLIKDTIIKNLWENKIWVVDFWKIAQNWNSSFSQYKNQYTYSSNNLDLNIKNTSQNIKENSFWLNSQFSGSNERLDFLQTNQIYSKQNMNNDWLNNYWWNVFKILWQIYDSYIILEWKDWVYFLDQHALAERILFEKLKKFINTKWMEPQLLLTPLKIDIPKIVWIEEKLDKINWIWFDVSLISQNRALVYSLPKIFDEFKFDIQQTMNDLILSEKYDLRNSIEDILADYACKKSIKSWQKLSVLEIDNLIKDSFENISQMFVCQHWRSSFVKIEKKDIDKMFDR